MRQGDKQLGTPFQEYKDTKANITALTGVPEGAIAYSTDTDELGTYNGSIWTWGQGGSLSAQDEGIYLGGISTLNVVGLNADFSVSGTVGRLFVTGSAAGTSDHESLTGLLGGSASNHYHLTPSQTTGLVSGTSTSLHSHATGTILHESLSDLLGGSANNHYHLTPTQVTELVSGTSTSLHSHTGSALGVETEVDFGATNVSYQTFTITNASVTTNSDILAQIKYKAPTGKSLDEVTMDNFDIIITPATGTFDMRLSCLSGTVSGKFWVTYLVLG